MKENISIEGFAIFLDLCCDFTDGLEGAHLQDSTVKRRGEGRGGMVKRRRRKVR